MLVIHYAVFMGLKTHLWVGAAYHIGFGKSSKSSHLSILTNHSPFSCFNVSSSFLAFICGDDKFWRLGLQNNCHHLVIHKLRGWWWPGWWWDSSNDQGIAGDKDPTSCPRRWWWHWIQGLWSVSIYLLLQSIFEQRDELRFFTAERLCEICLSFCCFKLCPEVQFQCRGHQPLHLVLSLWSLVQRIRHRVIEDARGLQWMSKLCSHPKVGYWEYVDALCTWGELIWLASCLIILALIWTNMSCIHGMHVFFLNICCFDILGGRLKEF